jgi:hypothetical protein
MCRFRRRQHRSHPCEACMPLPLVESTAELCQPSSSRECKRPASFWYDSNVVMSGGPPPSGPGFAVSASYASPLTRTRRLLHLLRCRRRTRLQLVLRPVCIGVPVAGFMVPPSSDVSSLTCLFVGDVGQFAIRTTRLACERGDEVLGNHGRPRAQ